MNKLKSLWRWFRIYQYGKPVFVGYFKLNEWKEALPFYSWYCKECNKLVVNYSSTHYETLKCPLCINQIIMERENL